MPIMPAPQQALASRDALTGLELMRKELGDYLLDATWDELATGLIVAVEEGDVVGAALTTLVSREEAGYFLEHVDKKRFPEAVGQIARAADEGCLGNIMAIAVHPQSRGRGIGVALVGRCMDDLRSQAVRCVIAEAWARQGPVHTSIPMFRRLGWTELATVAEYWNAHDKSSERPERNGCIDCGHPCHCTAVLFYQQLP
jgi:GNAT superfamily N-acetyltransferase